MSLDPYQPCPGGTGKKLKFCCSDLLGELQRLAAMMDGEQNVAALDQVGKLLEKYPGRACLLNYKLNLQMEVGAMAEAAATQEAFLALHPENPIALSGGAVQRAVKDARAGIAMMQDALEKISEQAPGELYENLGALGEVLLAGNEPLAARAHFLLQLLMSQGRDDRPWQRLMRMMGETTIPLLWRETRESLPAPPQAEWVADFDVALRRAARGEWRRAAAQWEALGERSPGSPEIWSNLAIVRGHLADHAGAAAAWRRYAEATADEDEAIEAEAMAQLLDREGSEGIVRSIDGVFPVVQEEELERRLASDRQFERVEFPRGEFMEAGQPAPRAIYQILDRPRAATGVGIHRGDIPRVLGQALLYGKQTDRAGRLELSAYSPLWEQAKTAVARCAGDALGPVESEESGEGPSAVEYALSWQWRLPDDTPAVDSHRLMSEERRALILEAWPQLALPLLGGRSPMQAAADPAERRKLQGAILLLEVSDGGVGAAELYAQLRERLGLPQPGPVVLSGDDAIGKIGLPRLARLALEKLSNEELETAFQRAATARYEAALSRLAAEVARRPEWPNDEIRLSAYQYLIRTEPNAEQSLKYVTEGRRIAEKLGISTAPLDLDELAVRIGQRDVQEMSRLIEHIRDQHINEPGIAEALFNVLYRAGIIGPDTVRSMQGGAGLAEGGPAGAGLPTRGGTPAGQLWTPESEAPAGKKSSLWLPE